MQLGYRITYVRNKRPVTGSAQSITSRLKSCGCFLSPAVSGPMEIRRPESLSESLESSAPTGRSWNSCGKEILLIGSHGLGLGGLVVKAQSVLPLGLPLLSSVSSEGGKMYCLCLSRPWWRDSPQSCPSSGGWKRWCPHGGSHSTGSSQGFGTYV